MAKLLVANNNAAQGSFICNAPNTFSYAMSSDVEVIQIAIGDIKFTVSKEQLRKIGKFLLENGLASADFENAIRLTKSQVT